jgi:hypothetical protein
MTKLTGHTTAATKRSRCIQKRAFIPRTTRFLSRLGPCTLIVAALCVLALASLTIFVPIHIVYLTSIRHTHIDTSNSVPRGKSPIVLQKLSALAEPTNETTSTSQGKRGTPSSEETQTDVHHDPVSPEPTRAATEDATTSHTHAPPSAAWHQTQTKAVERPSATELLPPVSTPQLPPVSPSLLSKIAVAQAPQQGRSPYLSIDIKNTPRQWQRTFLKTGTAGDTIDFRSAGRTRPWSGDFMRDGVCTRAFHILALSILELQQERL